MIEHTRFGNKYRLIWRTPRSKKVADVLNYTIDETGYRVIPVLLDDDLMQRIDTRFMVSIWEKTGPKIYVSTAYINLPREIGETGIWHEVGHIHHKHHLQNEFYDKGKTIAARILAIENGNVMSIEKEADSFAVLQSGKEAMIGFLELLLRTRPTGGNFSFNEIGKRELQMRIETIRKL
jgi:hypothetical protein